jgi:hypothetical protein
MEQRIDIVREIAARASEGILQRMRVDAKEHLTLRLDPNERKFFEDVVGVLDAETARRTKQKATVTTMPPRVKAFIADALKDAPDDLRGLLTEPAPEQAPREPIKAKPRLGIAFTHEQLRYLDRAVGNYHDPEPGDEEIAEEVLGTVAMALSMMKGDLT